MLVVMIKRTGNRNSLTVSVDRKVLTFNIHLVSLVEFVYMREK
jgi:hypothetical protein